MRKRFIVLLGIFVGSCLPVAAQTSAPQSVLAQARVAPAMTMARTMPSSLIVSSFLLSQAPGKSAVHASFTFAGAYERGDNLEDLWPVDKVKTLTLTRSTLALLQLWGGRLQLNAFQSSLHLQNAQSPFGGSGLRNSRLLQQIYPAELRRTNFSGLSVTFHFGRDARTEQPALLSHPLTQIVRTIPRLTVLLRLPNS
jgi:hypothetical protein